MPWVPTNGANWPVAFFGACALAFVNIIVPLAVLKLASRRRFWGVRTLLALPAVVAIPIAARMKVFPQSPLVPFVASTLLGLAPIILARDIGLSALNRRWRRLGVLLGLAILASVVIATSLLWFDTRGLAAIERYSWSGWYLVAIPATFVVGFLECVAWLARTVFELVRRLRRRTTVVELPTERR